MFEREPSDDSRPADALGLAGLEGMAPGPELAAFIHRIDPVSVTDGYDLVEIAAACRRLKAWADAVEVATAAALARHPVCHAPEAARHGFTPVRAAGQLLAARLGTAPSTACDRVSTAVQLVDELPDTVAALHQGEIDYSKAAALAVGVRQLDPADGACDRLTGEVVTPDGLRRGLVAEVEARVLPKAGRRSLRQHRDAIARAVAALAPKTVEERHERACEQRRVDYSPSPDGMAWLGVYGPAEDITAIRVVLDAAADAVMRENPADTRTADQVRVDVLAQLAWSSLESGHLGGQCGQKGSAAGKPTWPSSHRQRHRAVQHPHRTRRRARRARGLRADPGVSGSADRRTRHLASAAHRSSLRSAARPRNHALRPASGPGRPSDRT